MLAPSQLLHTHLTSAPRTVSSKQHVAEHLATEALKYALSVATADLELLWIPHQTHKGMAHVLSVRGGDGRVAPYACQMAFQVGSTRSGSHKKSHVRNGPVADVTLECEMRRNALVSPRHNGRLVRYVW